MDGQISYPPASGPGRPQALTNSGGTDKNVAGPVWYSAKKGYELNQLISMIIDDIDDLCSCSTIPNIYIYIYILVVLVT